MQTKNCSKCKLDKELSSFPRYRYKDDWKIRPNCKDCQKIMTCSWRERNKDHIKEYEKKYREENHEEVLLRSAEWRNKNRDHIAGYNKRKYWENPEDRRTKAIDAYWADIENNRNMAREYASREENKANRKKNMQNFIDKNPDYFKDYMKNNWYKYLEYASRRRWIKENATLKLTEDQIQQMRDMYWLAKDLNAVSGEIYEVDHIIPLRGKDICGLHVPWNLQILPRDLNRSKNNRYSKEEVLANPGVGTTGGRRLSGSLPSQP